jgi:hypothetical protein
MVVLQKDPETPFILSPFPPLLALLPPAAPAVYVIPHASQMLIETFSSERPRREVPLSSPGLAHMGATCQASKSREFGGEGTGD